MRQASWIWLVIFCALLVGVLYATPQFLIKRNLESIGQPFILNQFTELGDEGYFYLQHAREVYDGHFPPRDFFLDPEIQRPSIFNILPPTIFAGFIWLSGGDINLAYIVANLIIVPVLFLLFYFLGQFIFERNRLWSIFFSFVAVFTAAAVNTPRVFFGWDNFANIFLKNFYPGVHTPLPKLFLSRIDYPLTAYLIYIPAILIFLYFWTNPTWKKAAALGVFSGLLFHTYFHFWAYWMVVLGLAFLYSAIFLREDRERLRCFVIIGGIALFIVLPVFVNQIQLNNLDTTGEFEARVGHLIERGRILHWEAWPHYLSYAILAFCVYLLFWKKSKSDAVLFWIFLIAAVIAWNAHIVTGFVPVWRHWARAINPVIFIMAFALLYRFVGVRDLRFPKLSKWITVILWVGVSLLIAKKVVNAVLFVNPPPQIFTSYSMPPGIAEAMRWLDDLPGEPRLISPSFITSIHLSGLTSARPFLPWGIIAPLTNLEVEERYFIANKVFGVREEVLEQRLSGGHGLQCREYCNWHPIAANLTDDELNLYNFYFRDQGLTGIPDDKITELLERYRDLKIDWRNIEADYVYLGPLERAFTAEDFRNNPALETIFENKDVRIYKIKRL